jgi:hypothetical protein
MMRHLILLMAALLFSVSLLAEPVAVTILRTPNGGIQPRAAVSAEGDLHLIYYKGDAGHGDLFYVRMKAGEKDFSRPIQVNTTAGSAIAMGTIRGAQLAIGKGGRVHVAWNGSSMAMPKGPQDALPMLYTRLAESGDAFETERNVIHQHYGLDGGGSLAADEKGNVYIAWHAPLEKGLGETARRVWIAKSTDNGETFAPETLASATPTGACGCCGLTIAAGNNGNVYTLFRTATQKVHRDMYLLRSEDGGASFLGDTVSPMNINQCVMSSAALLPMRDVTLAAWETSGKVYWSRISEKGLGIAEPVAANKSMANQKHPALASDAAGNVLFAWSEGTGWNKGGSIAWQVYSADGKAVVGTGGSAGGLATWSFPAAVSTGAGRFTIVY